MNQKRILLSFTPLLQSFFSFASSNTQNPYIWEILIDNKWVPVKEPLASIIDKEFQKYLSLKKQFPNYTSHPALYFNENHMGWINKVSFHDSVGFYLINGVRAYPVSKSLIKIWMYGQKSKRHPFSFGGVQRKLSKIYSCHERYSHRGGMPLQTTTNNRGEKLQLNIQFYEGYCSSTFGESCPLRRLLRTAHPQQSYNKPQYPVASYPQDPKRNANRPKKFDPYHWQPMKDFQRQQQATAKSQIQKKQTFTRK